MHISFATVPDHLVDGNKPCDLLYMYTTISLVRSLSCNSELLCCLLPPLKICLQFIKWVKVVKGKTPQHQWYHSLMCEQYKCGLHLLNQLILNHSIQDTGSPTVNQRQGNMCCKCRVVPEKGENSRKGERQSLDTISVCRNQNELSLGSEASLSPHPPPLLFF